MPVANLYSPAELEGLLIDYSPLVKSTAARYSGRGTEYEDLVQEGYLALMRLIPMCADREWLAAFLKSRLPGYVRAEIELREMLARALTSDELDLTQALLEGFTQKELAALLGISQQVVGARIRRIRDKLSPLVRLR